MNKPINSTFDYTDPECTRRDGEQRRVEVRYDYRLGYPNRRITTEDRRINLAEGKTDE